MRWALLLLLASCGHDCFEIPMRDGSPPNWEQTQAILGTMERLQGMDKRGYYLQPLAGMASAMHGFELICRECQEGEEVRRLRLILD